MKNRKNKILSILNNTSNPKVSRVSELRKLADADQHGIFQSFQSNVADYATREKYLSQRGGEVPSRDTESLYNLGPEHKDSGSVAPDVNTSLSTRYSPDRVGVQARRIGDGVMQDPYTNKIYDYNEGFKTEDGREFPGGSTALQTDIMNLANHLDDNGFVKEANWADIILKKAQDFVSSGPSFEDALSTNQIADLMHQLMEKEGLSVQQASERLRDVDSKTPWVMEMLGAASPEASESAAAPAREARALATSEIVALMRAHEDPASAYKLSADRLAQVNNGNLTEEEAAIVDSATGITSISADVRKSLIGFSNSLDKIGLYEEADSLDALLKI